MCAAGPRHTCAGRAGVQVAQVSLRLWASFLNNSSSRWEAAWEAWPLRLELVDRVSAVYRSDHQRRARFTSGCIPDRVRSGLGLGPPRRRAAELLRAAALPAAAEIL